MCKLLTSSCLPFPPATRVPPSSLAAALPSLGSHSWDPAEPLPALISTRPAQSSPHQVWAGHNHSQL